MDVNCGAFVDLSREGRRGLPVRPEPQLRAGWHAEPRRCGPFSAPGVELVDIRDRKNPVLLDVYPVAQRGRRPHRALARDPGGSRRTMARAPRGSTSSRSQRCGDRHRARHGALRRLRSRSSRWNSITLGECGHDTYIQNDPIAHRTYLYIAGGFATGFYVFDVTDPLAIEPVADWDLTPECFPDWYSHTIDVTYRGKRRYVTLPSEMFDQGPSLRGGDGGRLRQRDRQRRPRGPDVDRGRLELEQARPASTSPARARATRRRTLASASRRRARDDLDQPGRPRRRQPDLLAAQPADRRQPDLPLALPRRRVRPRRRRRLLRQAQAPGRGRLHRPDRRARAARVRAQLQPVDPFFTEHLGWRPSIWDAYWYKGHVLAADMVGGFYSLQWRGDRPKRTALSRC